MTDTGSERVRLSPAGWSVAVVSAAILCLVLPLAALEGGGSAEPVSTAAKLLQFALTSAVALRLIQVLTGPARPMHAMVLLYSYVFLGLAPLAQLQAGAVPSSTRARTQERSIPEAITTSESIRTTLIIALGLVAYELVRVGLSRREERVSPPSASRQLSEVRVRAAVFLALPLTYAYVLWIGPGAFIGSRIRLEAEVARKSSVEALSPVATALGTVPIWVSFLALLIIHRRGEGGLGTRLAVYLSGGTALYVVNPITSPRFIVGTFYVALLTVLLCKGSLVPLKGILLGLTAALILVFPYADLFRYDATPSINTSALTTQWRDKLDYDSFGQINVARQFAADQGFQGGKQELGALLFFVPREAWPSKPIDTGALLAKYKKARFTNTSAPLWAESYIDFGYAGVVVSLGLLAALGHRLDTFLGRARGRSRELALLLVPLVAYYELIVLRGSLLAILGRLLAIGLVVMALTKVSTEFEGATAVKPPLTLSRS